MSVILEQVKDKVVRRLEKENLFDRQVSLRARVLSASEAIGNPEGYDFPLLKGKEKIIEARFDGHMGHAFTDMYGGYEGSLKDVFNMGLDNNFRRALVVASVNALMNYWQEVENTVHCKDNQPKACAQKCLEHIKEHYPAINRVALIGYQPAIAHALCKKYVLKILDLDKDNIGAERFGTIVLDGAEYLEDAVEWAQLVLATGSMIVNASIDRLLDVCPRDKVIFFGVTISGAADLVGLNRLCFPRTDPS